MIDKNSQINELYNFRHFHDKNQNSGVDYQNKLMSKLLSNILFRNKITNNFLEQIKGKFILMLESNLIARNFFNFTVNKYYNKHIN